MSEQFKQGDRKVVKQGENSYYVYDSEKEKWVDRWHNDKEGITNFFDEVATGNTDLKSIGTDEHGNPILRLKKYL
jgi:hypothetical protein